MDGYSRVEKMWIFILEQCMMAGFAGPGRTLAHHKLTYYIKINIMEEVRCLNKYDISVLLFPLLSSVHLLNEQKNTLVP